jgi:HKD family nuclease
MAAAISFITNTNESHKDLLLELFEQADHIIIAVGFLKQSGFNNIKEYLKYFVSDRSKSSVFYIGTGLGETHPDALQGIYNTIKTKANHELILCSPDAGIFHPKIYVFVTGRKVSIVTGSSNLTQHGWVVNDEVSTVVETTIGSSEYVQLEQYFNQLSKKYASTNTQAVIDAYAKQRKEYFDKFGKPPGFKFRRRRSVISGIDMPRLQRYYELYLASDEFVIPKNRELRYEQAKNNLDILASHRPLTEERFHKLFGQLVGHKDYLPKLWHSGSIHRTTYKTLDYADALRELVRLVKSSIDLPVGDAFATVVSKLNEMRKGKDILGVGVNIIAEMFLSYDPSKFANLNDNPLWVLEIVGRQFPRVTSFKSADYEEYIELLTKIKDNLNMETFLEIDSFFNYVYWNLAEE